MKIMLIEDNPTKKRDISDFLISKSVKSNDIIYVENMTDFTSNIHQDIGLFIIDLKLPNYDSGEASHNGRAILESIVKTKKNDCLLLAISSFPDEFKELRGFYESHGCILSNYSDAKGWQATLEHLLIQLNKNVTIDFIIFCALKEERDPYAALLDVKKINRGGIDFYDVEIDGIKGAIVRLPQMGLVNAAITAGVCIDRYKPVLVGMSGICGGFSKNVELGQLLISQMAYEYQSGKWTEDGFKQEPYQVSTNSNTLTNLELLVENDSLIFELEKGWVSDRPRNTFTPKTSVFTSGSAVIAKSDMVNDILEYHRKSAGLDMEVFAIHRAAELSMAKPSCICAKTVVDLCDAEKSDNLHKYGSYISARFMLLAIKDFFEKK